MRVAAALWVFLLILPAPPLKAMTVEERRQYLEKLLQTLPEVSSFRQWLQWSGEMPPDFDALPRSNDLPDPLRFLNGQPVRTPQEWKVRRAEIQELFQKYALGTFPPRPKIDRVVQTARSEERAKKKLNCFRVSDTIDPSRSLG